jgi:hypothetical protein
MGFLLPALTQENLDTQRDVVMNERRQRIDNQPYGAPASGCTSCSTPRAPYAGR